MSRHATSHRRHSFVRVRSIPFVDLAPRYHLEPLAILRVQVLSAWRCSAWPFLLFSAFLWRKLVAPWRHSIFESFFALLALFPPSAKLLKSKKVINQKILLALSEAATHPKSEHYEVFPLSLSPEPPGFQSCAVYHDWRWRDATTCMRRTPCFLAGRAILTFTSAWSPKRTGLNQWDEKSEMIISH